MTLNLREQLAQYGRHAVSDSYLEWRTAFVPNLDPELLYPALEMVVAQSPFREDVTVPLIRWLRKHQSRPTYRPSQQGVSVMTYTPSIEDFLSGAADPDVPEYLDPLTSIADSLRQLVKQGEPVELVSAASTSGPAEPSTAPSETVEDTLRQELADLEAKHDEIVRLVLDVEALIKPSTSKLANSVRSRINAWRNPPGAAAPESAEIEMSEATDTEMVEQLEQPAPDAPVEHWREYARCLHGLTNPVSPSGAIARSKIDAMNRSQIRTLLGIEQPVE